VSIVLCLQDSDPGLTYYKDNVYFNHSSTEGLRKYSSCVCWGGRVFDFEKTEIESFNEVGRMD